MKILILLIFVLVGFCLVCKSTFDARKTFEQQQQLLASHILPHTVV